MTIKSFRRVSTATLALSASLYALTTPAFAQSYSEQLDEIIVTGSPLTRSVDEAITGVSVLSGEELDSRLAATIGETLKLEPGVSATSFGAGASRPIIRGQGGDRVRVLTNGIGSIDASSASPDHAVSVEPAQAERIEVLRGAALLRYGSSGAGGVVNVIDGRIPSEMPDDITGALRLGGTSVDDGWDAAGSVDIPIAGQFVLHLDGTKRSSEDYSIPGFAESAALRAAEALEEEEEHDEDGHEHEDEEEAFGIVENSFVETESYTAGLSYVGDRGFIGFAFHDFSSDYGVPGGHGHEEGEEEENHDEDEEHEGEEEEELVTIGLAQQRFDVNGRLELDGFFQQIDLFAGVADYKHTEFEGDEIGTVFTNEGHEIRIEAVQREQNGWQAAYGVQLRKRDFSAIGDEAFVPPTTTDQLGLYTFHQKEVGDLHLEGSARFERTDQEESIGTGARRFNAVSLSVGGDAHLSDAVRIGGTVFRTERAPTTEELFSNGPHLATDQFELGDPTLGLETSTGIEAAFRHREDGHFLTANVFYTDYSDYIFEAATGEIEDGLDVFQFTAQDATFRGFEVQGGMDLGQISGFDISGDALVEYVRAKTDSGNLPRIPPLSMLVGLEGEMDSLKLRSEVEYAAEQNKVSAFDTPTEDYTLVNVFADYRASENITVSVSALNLFDDEARQHSSFLKELIPLPGRNFRVSLKGTF